MAVSLTPRSAFELRPTPPRRKTGRTVATRTERIGELLTAVGHAFMVLLYIAMILAILAVLFVPSVISGARR
jgi:hypothetical protein